MLRAGKGHARRFLAGKDFAWIALLAFAAIPCVCPGTLSHEVPGGGAFSRWIAGGLKQRDIFSSPRFFSFGRLKLRGAGDPCHDEENDGQTGIETARNDGDNGRSPSRAGSLPRTYSGSQSNPRIEHDFTAERSLDDMEALETETGERASILKAARTSSSSSAGDGGFWLPNANAAAAEPEVDFGTQTAAAEKEDHGFWLPGQEGCVKPTERTAEPMKENPYDEHEPSNHGNWIPARNVEGQSPQQSREETAAHTGTEHTDARRDEEGNQPGDVGDTEAGYQGHQREEFNGDVQNDEEDEDGKSPAGEEKEGEEDSDDGHPIPQVFKDIWKEGFVPDYDGKPPLLWEKVFDVAAGTVDIEAEHKARSSALDVEMWQAAEAGDAEVVKRLLQQGADANHRAGVTGHLPVLHTAAGQGHVDVVNALIDAGAIIDARDREGWTALHFAATAGECDAVRCLANRGADVNAVIEVINGSILHDFAMEEEDPYVGARMAECLASLGCIVDARTSRSRTPVHWAIDTNNIVVIQKLAELGADINAANADKWTPLAWSARMGMKSMVFALLHLGANVHKRCQNERTALFWAEQNGYEEIADVLRKYGISGVEEEEEDE